MRAILSATSHAAEALGIGDGVGGLAAGKRADLLVVEGGPVGGDSGPDGGASGVQGRGAVGGVAIAVGVRGDAQRGRGLRAKALPLGGVMVKSSPRAWASFQLAYQSSHVC